LADHIGRATAGVARVGGLASRVWMRNFVRELRTQRGLSQGQLATAMSVSRQTINSIEQERYTPSLPLALALARFFETTVEAMFDARD
jgi:putative transcriptional regulator